MSGRAPPRQLLHVTSNSFNGNVFGWTGCPFRLVLFELLKFADLNQIWVLQQVATGFPRNPSVGLVGYSRDVERVELDAFGLCNLNLHYKTIRDKTR